MLWFNGDGFGGKVLRKMLARNDVQRGDWVGKRVGRVQRDELLCDWISKTLVMLVVLKETKGMVKFKYIKHIWLCLELSCWRRNKANFSA